MFSFVHLIKTVLILIMMVIVSNSSDTVSRVVHIPFAG